jgi:hypothetical protein
MSKMLSSVLIAIALMLSSVTAISVALAIYALIDDKRLALLFASAAVLLDVFKYLAWPVAVRLMRGSRAVLMIACALMLSVVSGWATYDRLMSSITISKATHDAMSGGRLEVLKQLIQKDSSLILHLEHEVSLVAVQANDLRARGMVSKALELEESVSTRASKQRQEAVERINTASLEIASIESSVVKVSSLPAFLAQLLCVGFAMSLEIVPALILSGIRGTRSNVNPVIHSTDSNEPSPSVMTREAQETAPETIKTKKTLLDTNAEILETLVDQVKNSEPGTPIKLKEFAKKTRIGNLRAGEIFRNAETLGVIKKTTIGYVTLSS